MEKEFKRILEESQKMNSEFPRQLAAIDSMQKKGGRSFGAGLLGGRLLSSADQVNMGGSNGQSIDQLLATLQNDRVGQEHHY